MRWRARRPRNDRGATLAIVGCLLTALLGSGAMAIDLGMQRVVRSDAQATADVVALDLARSLDSRMTSSWYDEHWATAGGDLALSLGRNASAMGQAPPPPAPGWLCNTAVCAKAVAGSLDQSGRFVPGAPDSIPSAVSVVVTGRTLFGLARVLGVSAGAASRAAVGQVTVPTSCYEAGSFALGLATNSSILAPLLGQAAAARILSYRGLGTASVSLLGVAGQLGLSTSQQLLDASGITIGSFLTASAAVLQRQGDAASIALASQLTALTADLGPLATRSVRLGDLVSLGTTGGAALDADVRILDLLTGAVIAADGGHAIAVPALNLDLGALGSLSASLYLTQAPQLGCNGAPARTAQGRIDLTGSLTVAGLATLRHVTVSISLANATATLDPRVACTPDTITVDVTDQTLAAVRLTADVYAVLGMVQLGTLDSGTPTAPTAATYDLPVPASYTTPVTTGSGALGLDLSHVSLTAAGLSSGALVAGLAPLVSGVSTLASGTLLPGLGVTTAGADLWAVPPHACGGVALVG